MLMRRMLTLLVCLLWATAACAATPEDVERAITRGKEYLYAAQSPDGTWKQTAHAASHTDGGLTALVTYALLAAGESQADPRLAKSIEYLKNIEMTGVYAVGVRAQLWTLLPQTNETRALARKDAQFLTDAMKTEGAARGLFDYTASGKSGRTDHSVSQYGVLGLWAAAQVNNAHVPLSVWQAVEAGWNANQLPDGGWTYEGTEGQPRASMVAAGVASLFIAQDYTQSARGSACTGNIQDDRIDRGLDWITSKFAQVHEGEWRYYTLYGVERIGVASGRKYFGPINWYEHGAQYLVANQRPDGSWAAKQESSPVDTSFALLFLTRGRAPVAFHKLRYDLVKDGQVVEGRWNQRSRDVANITRWVGRAVERDLNWQVVNLDAPLAELFEAPVLYMSGSEALSLAPEHEAKLKAYIEGGGLVLANADCASQAFADSFQRLGQRLFPNYAFRELPNDHLIYRELYNAKTWRGRPSVLGLSNGVRELMILLPNADAGRIWQVQFAGRQELFQLGANILLYATDKQNLRYKGEVNLATRKEGVRTRRTLKLARIVHDANWDPEPGAWRRISDLVHNQHGINLMVEPVELDPVALGEGKLAGYDVAHLTGTGALEIDATVRLQLKRFVERGGTLIVDAAGGSTEFAQAIERELSVAFGMGQIPVLDFDHKAYWAGQRINQVKWRDYARRLLPPNGSLPMPLRLRGLTLDGRTALVYSPDDLTHGMLGTPVDGIAGYAPETATQLMTNLIVLAADGGK